jgi:dihydroorotate dehydrogenase electron transfer subunit
MPGASPYKSNARAQFAAEVVENRPLCREHFRLVLRLDAFPPTKPGQFIQVACRNLQEDAGETIATEYNRGQQHASYGADLLSPVALLRRPFSLAGRRDLAKGVELDLIHRVVGVGTNYLAHLRIGQSVQILGPLGNGFTLPPAGTMAILVGGGVGIPPMIYLSQSLAGTPTVAFCGALRSELMPLTIAPGTIIGKGIEPALTAEEFARFGVPCVVCTDDGSLGFGGLVTQAVERYLDQARQPTMLYSCGPEGMMKRVVQIASERGLESQIAVERAMACGMGTCQSCVIRMRLKPDDPANRSGDWAYKLACTDGPVFKGADLLW